MKHIRTAWLLWRLVRRLERDSRDGDVSAMLTLTVEAGEGYEQAARAREASGLLPPPRRRAYEANYWKIAGEGAYTRRGQTLGEALAQVLGDR